MQVFQLVEVTTQDKLIHQGVFFKPEKPGKRALLWVHGLASVFYSRIELLNEFAAQGNQHGFGFAAFNNRGHDAITGIRKLDPGNPKGYTHTNGGAGYEDFKASVFDIEAGISFLTQQGFSQIILIGHSTGANKVCYYAGSKQDGRVAGVILASPVSDLYDPALDKNKLEKDLEKMQRLIAERKGDELVLGYHFFPMTPKRFISLFSHHSLEDQFDYGAAKPQLKYFSRITKPLFVLLGEKDEYLHLPAEKIMSVYNTYQKSTQYKGRVLPNVLHSFQGAEKRVVKEVVDWISEIS